MSEGKYRDSVFRHYFIGDKRRLLSLVNAVLGTDCDDPDEIEINTLEASLFSAVRNDVSCFFRNQLIVLVEHQSTLNENMPLRFLFYVVELLRKLMGEPRRMYRRKLITFLPVRFFVIYNGRASAPERRTMRLSDAFLGDGALELEVEFININAGNNVELIERSVDLGYYCTFVELVQSARERGESLSKALKDAMEYCINNGIMSEYLRAHQWEVMRMYPYEYNEADAKLTAYEEGIEDGREDKQIELVQNFVRAGTPIQFIMTATGWTEEQIRAAVNDKRVM